MSSSTHKNALPPGTVLQNYRIVSVLGTGAFGIVYKAQHTLLDDFVAIKEYLPQHCATRDGNTVHPLTSHDEQEFELGIEDFLKEAKQLIKFDDHPSVIRCKDFFKMHGTAYLVMQLEHGLELAQVLKNHNNANQPLTENQIIALMIPVLEGLSYIHSQGVLHRDIKPANIFVRIADNRPLLIDFGAAKQDYGTSQKTQNQLHTVGYAPLEQVQSDGELGPWTDIHAVGAMMWRIILNANPPLVQDRTARLLQQQPDPAMTELENLRNQYSDFFIDAIGKAMALQQNDRFQTAEAFIQALQNAHVAEENDLDDIITTRAPEPVSATTTPTPPIGATTQPPPQTVEEAPRKDNFKRNVIAICVALVALVAGFIAVNSNLLSKDAGPLTETVQLNLEEELEIIHTLLSKAELDRKENISNINVINTLKSLGNLDEASKKNIEILEASVQKNEVSIEENMTRAQQRTLNLVEDRQKNGSAVDQAIQQVIDVTANAGMYEKSEFFTELQALVEEASALTSKTEQRSLINQKL